MLNFDKARRLEGVRYDIRGPVCAEALRMERAGERVIKLNTGNPAAFGLEPPDYIPEIIERNLSVTAAYSESQGLYEAREAIAAYSLSRGIPCVTPEYVFTGNGVSELITLALSAFLNDGDEILIPSPDYPLWTAASTTAGGRVVHYLCDEENNWYPDTQDIETKITKNTRAMVIINPNNPTGAVYPPGLLGELVDIARRHGLLILSDEIYDRLVMDGIAHVSAASLAPDLPVVTFNGLSKSHNLCGFRCGWMVISGDKSGIRGYLDGISVLASMRLCSNVPAQAVIKPALADIHYTDAFISPGGRLYEQREYVCSAIANIPGLSAVKPEAGLYAFPKIDPEILRINDDERFALDFLRAKHVLLTHGGSFNWPEPDHFRLVYLPKMDDLIEVMARLGDFLSGYRQF